jgi:predicted RNA-binding protein with PUA-like domain
MKSEPDALSIDDLKIKKRWYWDGVRNYEARNYMRDKMQVGDMVIFYHSSVNPAGPAGIAKVTSLPYPDFTQFDKKSKYFDPKATKERPIWHMVDVSFVRKFKRLISREELKLEQELSNMILWKKSRLSITPLTQKEFDKIVQLGNKAE